MTPDPFERWPELDTLFERALGAPPGERAAFLDAACGDDAALRQELETLLAAADETGDFLEDATAWLGERPAELAAAAVRDDRVGRTFSHYEVLEPLGEGGMGVVYRARDTRLDRAVTLKFIQPLLGADPEAKTRFMQEARAASALDHPNICTIYEIDETADGQLFIAMAYYAGETLAERLKRGPLPLEEAFDIATAVGHGLARAHEAGIVHRDLKPANVMLTRRGEARILDFGIAKLEGQDQTRTGARLGTAAYMSPEQASGKLVDRRTDVWALGALIYEMVSGRRPFARDNEQATIYAILNEEPEPVGAHRADAPDDLEPVLSRALAKGVDGRYPDMAALLEDLHAIRGGVIPAVMSGSGRAAAAARGTGRRRNLVLAGLALILLTAAGAVTIQFAGGPSALRELAFWSRSRPVDFEERDWILIADLQNETGDDVFDQSLNSAIDVAIRQSRYVNVFPRARVREALVRMGRQGETVLDEGLAREVAVRQNLKAVLAFEISNIDSTYVLTTRIVDPDSGFTVRSESARSVGKAGVLDAVDELATRLREDLGESLRSIGQRNVRLPNATTRSLEALKRHADGAVAWNGGNYTGALTLWREAVALDSTFAWAHASLGMAIRYFDPTDTAARHHLDKARSLLDRVTERERLWIRALISDGQEALDALRIYTRLYPGDRDAWYNLGNDLRQLNRTEEAVEAYRSSLEVDSMCAWCWVNTAMAYDQLGRTEEAREAFEHAFVLQPSLRTQTAGAINRVYGFVRAKLDDFEGARAVFEETLPRGPGDRAFGLRNLGLLALVQGRAALAIQRLEEATAILRTAGAPINQYVDQLQLASAYRMDGRLADARSALGRALDIAANHVVPAGFLSDLGKQLARQGDLEAAAAVLDLMSAGASADSSLVARAANEQLRGELHLARGELPAARARLEAAYGLWRSPDDLESLAQAHYAAGRLREAAAAFAEFLALEPIGAEAQEYWLQAFQTLADIHERLGERDSARVYLARLVELWKDGDPDLPALIAARNRLADFEAALKRDPGSRGSGS